MKKFLIILFTALMLITPVPAHSKESLRDFQIVWNRSLLFCDTEGRARRFEDRDPFIVKGREATKEEIDFFIGKALDLSQKDLERRIKKGLENRKSGKPYNWIEKEDSEELLNYLILYIDGKKYFTKNSVTPEYNDIKYYKILDVAKYGKNNTMRKKREDMGIITSITPGYEKANYWFTTNHYISPYIKERVRAFEVPKTLSLSDQLALVTYEYAKLDLKYDHGGSAGYQFQALDNGYGMCHSMTIVFKNFLEKSQIPHRLVFQNFVVPNPKKNYAHALLAVKIEDEWKYLDPVCVERIAKRLGSPNLTQANSQEKKIELGNKILKEFLGKPGALEEDMPDEMKFFDLREKEPERIWELWGGTFIGDEIIDHNWNRVLVGF